MGTGRPANPSGARPGPSDELRLAQRSAWCARRGDEPDSSARRAGYEMRRSGALRIALFQWEVDSTYQHPILDVCTKGDEALEKARRTPTHWHESDDQGFTWSTPSCAEERRLRLLEAALDACQAFDVDVLLLPEYSVRPETVVWLWDRLREPGHRRLSVWAGTFLNPHGGGASGDLQKIARSSGLPGIPGGTSVLTALLAPEAEEGDRDATPNQDRRREVRAAARWKKYPSVAMGEHIRPWEQPLAPLFPGPMARGELRSYLLELVCSEVFFVASPANVWPTGVRHDELLLMSGGARHPNRKEAVHHDVQGDLLRIGALTAMTNPERRSVILVPAMSSRATDYEAFAHAGFFAAGISTVFCNAVLADKRWGQSCFFGYGGWERRGRGGKTAGSGPGPYHGSLPGVFRQSSDQGGPLGSREQALVIADVDPRFQLLGKPRPQVVPPPLRLVAHLPLLEYRATASTGGPGSCRCQRPVAQPDALAEALRCIDDAVFAGLDGAADPYRSTADDQYPAWTVEALRRLALACPASWGLVSRADAYRDHHLRHHRQWPPPALVDWLWVDLTSLDNPRDTLPAISTPPYRPFLDDDDDWDPPR